MCKLKIHLITASAPNHCTIAAYLNMLHSDNAYACLRDNDSVCIFFKENNKTHTHTRTHTRTHAHASAQHTYTYLIQVLTRLTLFCYGSFILKP